MQSITYSWYANLIKPDWAPPAWLFGPVWSVLYLIIAITFGYVAYLVAIGKLPKKILIPFVLNLIFNFIFSPLQFGLQNNLYAAIDIILVWVTIVWFMKSIWKTHRFIALANIPYLAWVSFATI